MPAPEDLSDLANDIQDVFEKHNININAFALAFNEKDGNPFRIRYISNTETISGAMQLFNGAASDLKRFDDSDRTFEQGS